MEPVSCTCTTLRRAARAVTELYDGLLAPAGLGAAQLGLLRTIERHEAPSITALAEATGLDRSTLGRNLRVLARDGLVTIGPGRDERSRAVTLTDAARARLAVAAPLWAQAQARVAEALPAAQAEALRAALLALTALASNPAPDDTGASP
jgi:DNA-binding MarR family transcriptional regulator